MNFKNFGTLFSTAAVFMLLSSFAVTSAGGHKSAEAKMDIVDTAVASGNFTTLVEAVKAADLVEVLKGEGPFTVFAPTDEAFSKIPAKDLQALIADKEALRKVLTYHVIPSKMLSGQARSVMSAKTVNGETVDIKGSYSYGNSIKINDAKIIKADIIAANGVIHVVDRVIMPKS